MHSRRLGRLAKLTHGAAIIGLGLTDLGCDKGPTTPREEPHINAPAKPDDSNMPAMNATATPVASASAPAAPSASTPAAPSASAPSPPKHTNAPNKK